jgi:hypothetical protein
MAPKKSMKSEQRSKSKQLKPQIVLGSHFLVPLYERAFTGQCCNNRLHYNGIASHLTSNSSSQLSQYSGSLKHVLAYVSVTSTNSMELSPPWEAKRCSATQRMAGILCNPKVHYGIRNSPPMVPTVSHMNPIHNFPSYFFKIFKVSTTRREQFCPYRDSNSTPRPSSP